MQRVIKFRARFSLTGEWVYGSLHPDSTRGEINLATFFSNLSVGVLDAETLGQYTGLKDEKTLTDIYECDIIDMEGKIRGNIYESPEIYKALSTCVVAGMGYEDWENTKQRLVQQGKLVAEQSDLPQILRELG